MIADDCFVGLKAVNALELKDERGEWGCYLIFSQLSVRYPGAYRLRFQVFDVGG